MRQFPEGDPIRVRIGDNGHPLAFTWRGQPHRVATVEDVREPRLDWWSATGEIHRVYYLVTTDRGLICEIYRDVAADAWYLARVFD